MFYLERSPDDKGNWVVMMISPHQIGPWSLDGPTGQFVSSTTPGNASAFAGLPGYKCRLRWDDCMLELFDWDKIPINPNDPDSDTLWGWKSVAKNYQALPLGLLDHLSYTGQGPMG